MNDQYISIMFIFFPVMTARNSDKGSKINCWPIEYKSQTCGCQATNTNRRGGRRVSSGGATDLFDRFTLQVNPKDELDFDKRTPEHDQRCLQVRMSV